jgi:hypothetical protein
MCDEWKQSIVCIAYGLSSRYLMEMKLFKILTDPGAAIHCNKPHLGCLFAK